MIESDKSFLMLLLTLSMAKVIVPQFNFKRGGFIAKMRCNHIREQEKGEGVGGKLVASQILKTFAN